MKRFLVLLIAVGLVAWLVAPATSVAQGEITDVFKLDTVTGNWSLTTLAKAYKTGSLIDSSCNQKYWNIDVYIEASVAQWVHWYLTNQGWSWKVKKPGCYAADCISFWIASNGNISINYEDFNDLKGTNNHKDSIDTYYWFGVDVNSAGDDWVRAIDLNNDDDTLWEASLVGDYDLHSGISWHLWNKICVVECNTACEYSDEAMITLGLEQQKDWLDDFGNWK